jgi:hypothetical protein
LFPVKRTQAPSFLSTHMNLLQRANNVEVNGNSDRNETFNQKSDDHHRSVWQSPGCESLHPASAKIAIELPDELSQRACRWAAASNRHLHSELSNARPLL